MLENYGYHGAYKVAYRDDTYEGHFKVFHDCKVDCAEEDSNLTKRVKSQVINSFSKNEICESDITITRIKLLK